MRQGVILHQGFGIPYVDQAGHKLVEIPLLLPNVPHFRLTLFSSPHIFLSKTVRVLIPRFATLAALTSICPF